MHGIRWWLVAIALTCMEFAACRAQEQAEAKPQRPVLRVAYFIPTDREPLPDYSERLERTLGEVQRFFRDGMEQNGHGRLSFELERDAAGKLVIHEVRAKGPMRDYGREAAGKVRTEVRTELAQRKLFIDHETILIFQLLLDWQGDKAIEIGPYVGGGDAHSGTAWVYDDAKLDARLLASKEPGGYYHGPCSLGQFNTHYIGGIAHELGHGLGLPHERERPLELPRRGNSLMGAGNHTYGQELRGEGQGAFLTAAAALPLSVHPLFTGSKQPPQPLTCRLAEIDASTEPGKLTLTGRLEGGPRVVGLVAYSDPQAVAADYDSSAWTCQVDAEGKFRLTIEDLTPGVNQLRLRPIGERGDSKYLTFVCEVDDAGIAQVGPLLEGPWLTEAHAAFALGDKQLLAEIAARLTAKQPKATELARKLAHYQALLAVPKLQAVADLPDETKIALLSELKLEAADVGWGRPLRNQVLAEGGDSVLLEVGGKFFESGLYAHAPARHAVRLNQKWTTLSTQFGLQDRHTGSVVFVVKADGKELFRSDAIRDHQLREAKLSVAGVDFLELIVEDAADGGSSDWGVWLQPQLER